MLDQGDKMRREREVRWRKRSHDGPRNGRNNLPMADGVVEWDFDAKPMCITLSLIPWYCLSDLSCCYPGRRR